MHLRRATAADKPLLEYWDTKAHVIAATGDEEGWDWDAEISQEGDWHDLLIAVAADNRPVGMVLIVDPAREDTHYWGDVGPNLRAIDIWIGEESDLGRGLGTEMMRLALGRCFADPGVTSVLIDPLASNIRAHRFYERIGFRVVGPRRFGDDDCLVYRLERAGWDAP